MSGQTDTAKSIGKKLPTQEMKMEQALLGSIILNPEVLYALSDTGLHSEDFSFNNHRLIFHAIQLLHNENQPIDSLSIVEKLLANDSLEMAGGKEYVATLPDAVPSSVNAKYYAGVIKQKSVCRKIIDAGNKISKIGHDAKDAESQELLEKVDGITYSLFADEEQTKSYSHIGDGLKETFNRIEQLHNSDNKIRGVPTGLNSLDKRLSGFQPSDLIILAARPSVGKTALAIDIARKMAVNHNAKVGIFSIEMSHQQLLDRLVSAEAGVSAWKLRVGTLKAKDDMDRTVEAIDRLSKASIFIDDRAGSSINSIRTTARRMKKENNIDLLIIDYLQLINPSNTFNNNSLVQQITEISHSLKHIARELNTPFLALSQLSRNVEHRGGAPRLSDLRDSGSIEQDADVVMFIHKDGKREGEEEDFDEKGHPVKIIIAKHRNGPTGQLQLYFDKNTLSFKDIDASEYNPEENDVLE